MATHPKFAPPLTAVKAATRTAKVSLSVLIMLGGFSLTPGMPSGVAVAQTASPAPQASRMRWQPKAEQGKARGTLSGGRRGKNAGDATARWKPSPEQGKAQGTLSGGRRGPDYAACDKAPGAARLKLLVPPGQASLLARQAQPTFMWQVWTQDATEVEFVLSDVTQPAPLYTSVQAVEGDRLMQATLPETASLKPGQRYRWTVLLQCTEGEAVEIYARSFVQLADGESLGSEQPPAHTASSRSQAALELAIAAAEEGIWYDALAYAYLAQVSDPSNGEAASALSTLLGTAR